MLHQKKPVKGSEGTSKASFQGMLAGKGTGSHAEKGPLLGLVFCYCLKFLILFKEGVLGLAKYADSPA